MNLIVVNKAPRGWVPLVSSAIIEADNRMEQYCYGGDGLMHNRNYGPVSSFKQKAERRKLPMIIMPYGMLMVTHITIADMKSLTEEYLVAYRVQYKNGAERMVA